MIINFKYAYTFLFIYLLLFGGANQAMAGRKQNDSEIWYMSPYGDPRFRTKEAYFSYQASNHNPNPTSSSWDFEKTFNRLSLSLMSLFSSNSTSNASKLSSIKQMRDCCF